MAITQTRLATVVQALSDILAVKQDFLAHIRHHARGLPAGQDRDYLLILCQTTDPREAAAYAILSYERARHDATSKKNEAEAARRRRRRDEDHFGLPRGSLTPPGGTGGAPGAPGAPGASRSGPETAPSLPIPDPRQRGLFDDDVATADQGIIGGIVRRTVAIGNASGTSPFVPAAGASDDEYERWRQGRGVATGATMPSPTPGASTNE